MGYDSNSERAECSRAAHLHKPVSDPNWLACLCTLAPDRGRASCRLVRVPLSTSTRRKGPMVLAPQGAPSGQHAVRSPPLQIGDRTCSSQAVHLQRRERHRYGECGVVGGGLVDRTARCRRSSDVRSRRAEIMIRAVNLATACSRMPWHRAVIRSEDRIVKSLRPKAFHSSWVQSLTTHDACQPSRGPFRAAPCAASDFSESRTKECLQLVALSVRPNAFRRTACSAAGGHQRCYRVSTGISE
ncbi:hypothetical protein NONI108955_05200 [Nocardia ninae]